MENAAHTTNATSTHANATVEDVAAHFKVSAQSVRKWALDGKIPCYRLGAQYRFDLAEVLKTLRLRIEGNDE